MTTQDVMDAARAALADGEARWAPSPERHEVHLSMAGEDMRALLARLLLFVDADDGEFDTMHLDVTPQWVIGRACDGQVVAFQKMRCEADGEGVLVIGAEDAQAILAMIPRPSRDIPLSDVHVDFIHAPNAGDLPVNVVYRAGGRVRSHSFETQGVAFARYGDVLRRATAPGAMQYPHAAIWSDSMISVLRAAGIARDQRAPLARITMFAPHPDSLVGDSLAPGRLVVSFANNRAHDLFVAVIPEVPVGWDADERADGFEGTAASVLRASGESARLRPVLPGVLD